MVLFTESKLELSEKQILELPLWATSGNECIYIQVPGSDYTRSLSPGGICDNPTVRLRKYLLLGEKLTLVNFTVQSNLIQKEKAYENSLNVFPSGVFLNPC